MLKLMRHEIRDYDVNTVEIRYHRLKEKENDYIHFKSTRMAHTNYLCM